MLEASRPSSSLLQAHTRHGAVVYLDHSLQHRQVSSQRPSIGHPADDNPCRLSTVLQILLFLPLTLATLSTPAFLLLSLLLFIHSLIHGTLLLLWGSPALSVLQVPMHPFLLLLCFNLFSQNAKIPQALMTTATWWGRILGWSSPWFIVMEGLSSLLVAQKLGQVGRHLAGEGEGYQFGLLIGAAAVYVSSAWWVIAVSCLYFLKTSNRPHVVPVLSCCGELPVIINSPRCCLDDLPFPHPHWLQPATHERDRVLGSRVIPGLQYLAMRFRSSNYI